MPMQPALGGKINEFGAEKCAGERGDINQNQVGVSSGNSRPEKNAHEYPRKGQPTIGGGLRWQLWEIHILKLAAHPKKKAIAAFKSRKKSPARIANTVRRANSMNEETKQQRTLMIQAACKCSG